MKTFRLFTVLALSALLCFACKSNNTQEEERKSAETTENTQAGEAEAVILDAAKTAAGIAFLEEFYTVLGEDLLNYEYLKQNITPNLKQYLIDSYDYECEGECMASWLFFYDSGADITGTEVRKIEPIDNNNYLVKIHYNRGEAEDYFYSVKLGLVQEGDSFKIDSLEQKENRFGNS